MFYIIDFEALVVYVKSNLLDKDVQFDQYKTLFSDYKIECQEAEYVEQIINCTLVKDYRCHEMIYDMLDSSIKIIHIVKIGNGYLCLIHAESLTFILSENTISAVLKRISFIMYVDKYRIDTSFPIQSFGKEYIVTGSDFVEELLKERTIDIMHFIRLTKDIPKFDRQIYNLIKNMIPNKLYGYL